MAVECLISILKAFSGSAETFGNETPWVLRNIIRAVCEHAVHPTPVHVFRALVDDDYRNAILDGSTDPLLKLFQKQYETLLAKDQMTKFSPAINKEGKLMHPTITTSIGQDDCLDFLDIMNSRKILICRFSKGRLGDDVAELYASLVSALVSISAMKRESQAVRPPFFFLVDEAGSAGHGGRFKSMLEESRKYGLSLCLGFQGMYQLPFAEAVSNNCSTKIIYNSSGAEAEATVNDWACIDGTDYLSTEKITRLPRYQFFCRTFKKDKPEVNLIKAAQPLKPRYKKVQHRKTYQRSLECEPQSLIRESLMRWSRPKSDIQKHVNTILSEPA